MRQILKDRKTMVLYLGIIFGMFFIFLLLYKCVIENALDSRSALHLIGERTGNRLSIYYTRFYSLICFFLLVLVSVSFFLYKINSIAPEKMFLCIVVLLGSIYLMILPPISIPDDHAHFSCAYRYADRILGDEVEDKYFEMRKKDLAIFQFQKYVTLYDYRLQSNLLHAQSRQDQTMVWQEGQDIGNVLLYLPCTIGIVAARLLNFNAFWLFTCGRLCNFVCYIFCIYGAIRKMPAAKGMLAVIGLLPIAIQQGASYSYDSVILGAAFLFTAYMLHWIYSKESVRKKDIVVTLVAGCFIAVAKYGVYIFLLLLAVLIPKEKFGKGIEKRKYIIMLGAASAASMVTVNLKNVLWVVNKGADSSAPATTNSIHDIAATPHYFIFSLFRTTVLRKDSYVFEMIGNHLGCLDIQIPMVYIAALMAILWMTVLRVKEEEMIPSRRDKLTWIAIAGLVFLLVICAAYTWMEKSANVIEGVQGRYFLPILPLIMLCFRTRWIQMEKNVDKLALFLLSLVQSGVVLSILRMKSGY